MDGARQPQQRRGRRAQDGLLATTHHLGKTRRHVRTGHHDAREIDAEGRCHLVLELALVEARVLEADAEGAQLLGHVPARQHRGDRGVETTRQVNAHRNVGAQPDAGGVIEQPAQLLLERSARLTARPFPQTEIDVPPSPQRPQPALGDAHAMAGRELEDARKRRAVGEDRPQVEGLDERIRVEPALGSRVAQQRCRLGREGNVTIQDAEEERPDAEAVAGQEELPSVAVPDRERELAVQALQARLAPLLVGVDEHLRVTAGPEAVTERLELSGQLGVVEDLAVLHRPKATVLVRQWLVATGEVDDRQPRVHHPEAAVAV